MIAAEINRDHVLEALARIDRAGVHLSRKSRSVVLRHEDKYYPPKLVLSVASEIATNQTLPSAAFITTEAERFLLRLGFSVIRTVQQSAADIKERTTSEPSSVVSDLSAKEIRELGQQLVYSSRLYQWSELKNNPTLPPRSPGVYAWFFKRIPPGVPTDSCVVRDAATLL